MDIKVGYVIRFRAPLSPKSDETAESIGKVTEIRENGKTGTRYTIDVKGHNFWNGHDLYLNRASVTEVLRKQLV